MDIYLAGALTMTYAIAGLFFLKFWSTTHDSLFAYFTAAFWLLAAQRIGFEFLGETHEHTVYLYLLRLVAFVIIIVAIVNKNRIAARGKEGL
jgi:hypothetical protein